MIADFDITVFCSDRDFEYNNQVNGAFVDVICGCEMPIVIASPILFSNGDKVKLRSLRKKFQ